MKGYLEIGERPWGKYYVLEETDNYKLKRIEVNPNCKLSYQYHHKRSEIWTIVRGQAAVTIDGVVHNLMAGDHISIPSLAKHRIENIGTNMLIFIEVQLGTYFGEDDIIRISDDFNRL